MSRQSHPFAVVLGTNEIASAVAVALHRDGYSVTLSHDPNPPVIRRGMAFHDVLYDDPCLLEGVVGRRADCWFDVLGACSTPNAVAVTWLALSDLIAYGAIDLLVDGRMQKYTVTPDLRHLSGLAVGLGPGFRVGSNCDIAIETHPAQCGTLVDTGATATADRVPSRLGEFGGERFAYAPTAGRWRTAVEIGKRVYKGFTVGHLDGRPVRAPLDGVLRGAVRDGFAVPTHAKLLEVDPRGRKARWTGIDERPRAIAAAVARAVHAAAVVPRRTAHARWRREGAVTEQHHDRINARTLD